MLIKTAAELAAERLDAERDSARATARSYLAQTDWLVVRQAETGTPVPPEVLTARAEARAIARA